MKTNIIEYLFESTEKHPDKTAYFDEMTSLSYGTLTKNVKAIASKLIKKSGTVCRPVLIYMDKAPNVLCAFWGVTLSRNFYVPLDTDMPDYRIKNEVCNDI